MKVKIGDTWYDSNEQPICIQVSEQEQRQIADIDRSIAPKGKYAIFPDIMNWTHDQMREWMQRGE